VRAVILVSEWWHINMRDIIIINDINQFETEYLKRAVLLFSKKNEKT